MTSGGLGDYFSFLFPEGSGLVLAIGGYFDESERREAGEPICVGGYLFKPAAYVKFKRQWNRTVLRHKQRGFTHFHMTDLCCGQAEYKGLSIAVRVEILNLAVDAIAKHAYGGIGIYFEQAEFERVAPPEWAHAFGSIYSAACHLCLQTTAFWLNEWHSPMRVLYVFERGHKFQAEADEVLSAIGKNEDARKAFRYRNHLFEDKKTECGLQAADLLVWFITKAGVGAQISRSFRPFVEPLMRLSSSNRSRQQIHPFTGDLLKQFIAEQITGDTAFQVNFGPRKRSLR